MKLFNQPIRIFLFACALSTSFFSQCVFAALNKSGVSPQVITKPTGPGSISGLGESFGANLNSGTASYRVPLAVPPGRAGFAPEIILQYNGGTGNGALGIGWGLTVPHISRKTSKGLPVYDDTDTYIKDSGEDFVLLSDGFYRPEIEASYSRFSILGEAWLEEHADGSRSFYGENIESRDSLGPHTYRWKLSRKVDANGNEISYRYNEQDRFEEGFSSDGNATYLTSIRYNADLSDSYYMEIQFRYEGRQPNDQLTSYRSRFPIKLAYRLKEIVMVESVNRVRSYRLYYDDQQGLSRLQRIETYGKDETLGPVESTLSFEYSQFSPDNVLAAMSGANSPSVGLESPDAEIADMNGDGYPDVLYTGDFHVVNLNLDGATWGAESTIPGGFGEVRLNQANTMLLDMDADGFADLFQQDISINGYRYFSGQPQTADWAQIPIELQNSPSFTFGFNTRPIDLDLDGRIDVIRKNELSSEVGCVFNLDGTSYSGLFSIDSPSISAAFNFQASNNALNIADMNGDGLQDFVVLNAEGQVWYYPGRGVTLSSSTPSNFQGWDSTAVNWPDGASGAEGYWMDNAPDRIDEPDFSETSSFRAMNLMDANGDGLTDLVYVANNRVRLWINRGGYEFSEDPITISDSIPDDTAETFVRTADMNANGTTDIVWNRQSGFVETGFANTAWVYLDFSAGERPNLLKSIDNGLGAITTIDYMSSSKYLSMARDVGDSWDYSVPFPVNVISRVAVQDGMGNVQAKNLAYSNAYYDGEDKEFAGFEEASEVLVGDSSIGELTTEYLYHTGQSNDALKGKIRNITTKDSSQGPFYTEEYVWDVPSIDGSVCDSVAVHCPVLVSQRKTFIENNRGSPVTLEWEFEYDGYGNTTVERQSGRTDGDWDDEKVEIRVFSSSCNGLSSWLNDLPISEEVTDENGNRTSLNEYFYDDSNAACSITKGNLTKRNDWVGPGQVVPNLRQKFDSWGNISAIYDPLFGSAFGHSTHIQYDSQYNTYPVVETLSAGTIDLVATAEYDLGLGAITEYTDYNGQTTRYRYDNFGRLVTVAEPGDTLSSPTIQYEYSLGNSLGDGRIVNWIETRNKTSGSSEPLRSRVFYDGLSQELMQRSQGDIESQVVVERAAEINVRGKTGKQYLPYFDSGGFDYKDPPASASFVTNSYDALARVIGVQQPDGTFGTTEYFPLAKIVRDEEQTNVGSEYFGAATRYIEDGLLDEDGRGRLRQVHEIVLTSVTGEPMASPSTWITSYDYDLSGNLTRSVDSLGNQRILTYDGLGRLLERNDPDAGITTYSYDVASNLVRREDANGNVILWTYDGANRLLQEEVQGNSSSVVTYHYDSPIGSISRGQYWRNSVTETIRDAVLGLVQPEASYDQNEDGQIDVADLIQVGGVGSLTTRNGLGRLVYVSDQLGKQVFSYDERGNIEWQARTFDDLSEAEQSFVTSFQYDSLGRSTAVTYPNGTQIDYAYGLRGLLQSVTGYVRDLQYEPDGQYSRVELTSGVVSSLSYDDRLRVSRLRSVRQGDSLPLQDYSYEYDAVSNIVRIEDGRSAQELEMIGEELGLASETASQFSASVDYDYDSVYRLTNASNSEVFGSITYRYDPIGNLLLKDADLVVTDEAIDLGTIENGGAAGNSGRVGRAKGDPPGPHAMTGSQRGLYAEVSYDDNGNVVAIDEYSFEWNGRNQLTNIGESANPRVRYRYDYKGNRKISEFDGALDTLYINKYSEIRDGKLINYVYADDLRIAQLSEHAGQSKAIFYVAEYLGSTNLATDEIGSVVQQQNYYPFGRTRMKAVLPAATDTPNYSFVGKEQERLVGIYYFEARYLQPNIGFMSVDPALLSELSRDLLTEPQRLSAYSYAGNRPTVADDPDGEALNIAIGAIVGGTVNLVSYALTTDEADIDFGEAAKEFTKGAISGGIAASGVGLIGGIGALSADVGLELLDAAGTAAVKGEDLNGVDLANNVAKTVAGSIGGSAVGSIVGKVAKGAAIKTWVSGKQAYANYKNATNQLGTSSESLATNNFRKRAERAARDQRAARIVDDVVNSTGGNIAIEESSEAAIVEATEDPIQ